MTMKQDWDNDKETETKEPLPKMASELTLRELFAKDAPDVPDWFYPNPNNFYEPKFPENREDVEQLKKYTDDLFIWSKYNKENIYFHWRLYYADKMIELLK